MRQALAVGLRWLLTQVQSKTQFEVSYDLYYLKRFNIWVESTILFRTTKQF